MHPHEWTDTRENNEINTTPPPPPPPPIFGLSVELHYEDVGYNKTVL